MIPQKLIEDCKKQDRKAQQRIEKIYAGKFFTPCLLYSSNYEEAKDNLQDGFIKIFENIGQYKGKGFFEGWMIRIIINTSLKGYKNRTIFLFIKEEEIANPDVETELKDLSVEFLKQIIKELPERYQVVLIYMLRKLLS